jgi:hypothetical protein
MKPDFDADAVRVLSTIIHMVDPQPVTIQNACFDLVADALRAAYDAGLERAAEIASAWRNERGYKSVAIIEVVERIRSEKESDHG